MSGKRRKAYRAHDRQEILRVQARSAGAGRDRAHKLGAIALLIIALAGVVWAGMVGVNAMNNWMFAENEYFQIRHLDIESNGRLQPSNIREYARLSEGLNLFAVDINQVRSDLESVPLVRHAEVRRKLPDTLVVRVTERSAIARIKQPDWPADLSVDREGYILGVASRTTVLPAISGIREKGLSPGSQIKDPAVGDALLAIEITQSPGIGQIYQFATLDVSHPEYIEARLSTGQRALISRENLRVKLEALAEIARQRRDSGTTWAVADLTVDRNFPVQ